MTDDDQKVMKKIVFDGVLDALEQVVFPRFDHLEDEVSGLKQDVGGLKQDVGGLKQDVVELKSEMEGVKLRLDNLDNEMFGIKQRLGGVEKKLDKVLDSDLVLRDHDKRILKLERVATVV